MIDASHNKRFDFTKAEDVYALANCDANSNYCDFLAVVTIMSPCHLAMW